ncbi:MAG: M20/M25/M40 family metallo-hydrolase [Methanomicrobiaceae archaeon]|nr:M20/M25/M40 family metallo-hydrolase [Methanomicrobiaceae archaeon]
MMDPARHCAEMVKIRSENPPGDTREVICYLEGVLSGLGIPATIVKNKGGRWNLVVDHPDHSLLLCGHVDVVPAIAEGWSVDPFGGVEQNGYIWGRGATDMKGGVACIISALRRLADTGVEPAVNLAFVCDEETGGAFGVRDLLAKHMITPCDCLIAEPTPALHPLNGQKGLCQIRVEFSGEPGHGSLYPHIGVSAIMEAYALLDHLKTLNARVYDPEGEMEETLRRSAEVLGEVYGIDGIEKVLHSITYNPGRIEGGEKANIVAQKCTLELDLRVPWGCDVARLVQDIQDHAPRGELIPQSIAAPSYTPAESFIVRTTCEEVGRFYGKPASPIVQWAASDSRFLRKAGFACVEYGPGEIRTLHGIDERVSIENLYAATTIYEGIIRRYLAE